MHRLCALLPEERRTIAAFRHLDAQQVVWILALVVLLQPAAQRMDTIANRTVFESRIVARPAKRLDRDSILVERLASSLDFALAYIPQQRPELVRTMESSAGQYPLEGFPFLCRGDAGLRASVHGSNPLGEVCKQFMIIVYTWQPWKSGPTLSHVQGQT